MAEKTTEASPFNWRLPLFAALVAFAVAISIAVCQSDTALFLYLFFVAPILIAFTIALLVYTIIGKGRRKRLTLLFTLAHCLGCFSFSIVVRLLRPYPNGCAVVGLV